MKSSKNVRLIRLASIVIIVLMLVNIVTEIFTTIKTTYDIKEATKVNKSLKTEEEKLKVEVAKLNDDKYIQSYVSGTIFSTEKGTTVYVLPKDKEKASK